MPREDWWDLYLERFAPSVPAGQPTVAPPLPAAQNLTARRVSPPAWGAPVALPTPVAQRVTVPPMPQFVSMLMDTPTQQVPMSRQPVRTVVPPLVTQPAHAIATPIVTAPTAAAPNERMAIDFAGGWQWDIFQAERAQAAAQMALNAELQREQMALQRATTEMELAYRYKLMESQNQQAARDFGLRVGQLELNRQLATGWVQRRPITEGNMPALGNFAFPTVNWGQVVGRHTRPGWAQGGGG